MTQRTTKKSTPELPTDGLPTYLWKLFAHPRTAMRDEATKIESKVPSSAQLDKAAYGTASTAYGAITQAVITLGILGGSYLASSPDPRVAKLVAAATAIMLPLLLLSYTARRIGRTLSQAPQMDYMAVLARPAVVATTRCMVVDLAGVIGVIAVAVGVAAVTGSFGAGFVMLVAPTMAAKALWAWVFDHDR